MDSERIVDGQVLWQQTLEEEPDEVTDNPDNEESGADDESMHYYNITLSSY
jgi:hypothetical protein